MSLRLNAPLSGILVPIDTIPDPVFAQKTLGDGISIDPTSNVLLAPCSGKILQLHRCLHALTLRHESGVEVMVHIGIDTVSLKGQGFEALVKQGDTVTSGQPLIRFDADYVARNAASLLTQIIVLNGDLVSRYRPATGKVRAGEMPVLELELQGAAATHATDKTAGTTQVSEKIKIINPNGLHARPVAVMAAAAKSYKSHIQLVCRGQKGNAKSVVAVMGLDVRFNDEVFFEASGEDSAQALAALTKLLREGLGETHAAPSAAAPTAKVAVPAAPVVDKDPNRLSGVTASPGVAVGTVFQVRHQDIDVQETASDAHAERKKLDHALDQARAQLNALQASMRVSADGSKAAIFAAHEEILTDPDILVGVDEAIAAGKSAAYAWKATINAFANNLASLKNELLAARANDVRDVGSRVLRLLTGETHEPKMNLPENVILVAEDLTPSDVAEIDVARVRGFCTVAGGSTSHVAILARAFGIPALAAMNPKILDLVNGATVVLEAEKGFLQLNPSATDIQRVQSEQAQLEKKRKEDLQRTHEPAKTLDGMNIEVAANIGKVVEAEKAVTLGADGVGLLRSEFLFLERSAAPSEDEQFEIYRKIAKTLGKTRPLIIRTLDVGGDKPLSYLPIPKEENPFLGERGIRIGLNRPEILRTQLRAILRASVEGSIKVMFPMIATTHELLEAKTMLAEESKALNIPMIPVGIMVEVPSTAILADKFAPLVDFFSVGTNDLTQYTLAMDRGNPKMAKQIDALDPAVLRLIDLTVKAAKQHGKWVGVCGGIASETVAVPLLVGLGVTELSVSVPAVPGIKAQVRKIKFQDCQQLVTKALACDCAAAVRAIVRSQYVI